MDSISVNLENLSEQERDSLMKLIEKANKSKDKVWKPDDCETYYCVCSDGSINRVLNWVGDSTDESAYAMGSCFHTEEEAKEEVTRRKMLKRWKDLSIESGEEDNPWNGNNHHWYTYLDKGDVRISSLSGIRDANIFFRTRASCEAAVKELGIANVKKYIFGIKE